MGQSERALAGHFGWRRTGFYISSHVCIRSFGFVGFELCVSSCMLVECLSRSGLTQEIQKNFLFNCWLMGKMLGGQISYIMDGQVFHCKLLVLILF